MKLNKTILISICIVIIGIIVYSSFLFRNKKNQLCIDDHCIDIALARTQAEQEQWLMFVKQMNDSSGMLFIFNKSDIYTFWMKNTLIPLDMIRINKQHEIIDIKHATPCTTEICATYEPQGAASYVLEINEWLTDKRGIKIGEKVHMLY